MAAFWFDAGVMGIVASMLSTVSCAGRTCAATVAGIVEGKVAGALGKAMAGRLMSVR